MTAFSAGTGIGVATYMGLPIGEVGDGTDPLPVTRGHFDAPAHLVDDDGRLPTGLLASLADSIGGFTSGLASLPDWIVTTNLTLRRSPTALGGPAGSPGTGPLEIEARALRRGRSATVTRIDTTDSDRRWVATAWMTCAVMSPDDGPPFSRPVRLEHRRRSEDPEFLTRPSVFFGLDADDPGSVTLGITDRLRNPWGILHGGCVAVIVDAAAGSAVTRQPVDDRRPDVITSELVIHYLSPGRIGPVHADAKVIGRRGVDHLVRVEVTDAGAGNRLMALAVATVTPVPPVPRAAR